MYTGVCVCVCGSSLLYFIRSGPTDVNIPSLTRLILAQPFFVPKVGRFQASSELKYLV
jgi:hypothetical protein